MFLSDFDNATVSYLCILGHLQNSNEINLNVLSFSINSLVVTLNYGPYGLSICIRLRSATRPEPPLIAELKESSRIAGQSRFYQRIR
jgi:hypothetical protein